MQTNEEKEAYQRCLLTGAEILFCSGYSQIPNDWGRERHRVKERFEIPQQQTNNNDNQTHREELTKRKREGCRRAFWPAKKN